jgi:hypothetical protein
MTEEEALEMIEEMFLQAEREGEFERVRDEHGNPVLRDGQIQWRLARRRMH